jgi:3-hydroxyisobutyrate dehydrogenase-like beta-hydroxyacid dehydrogenase
MGQAMAKRLMNTSHGLVVYNRTKSKAESLLAAGALWGNGPADAARQSDVVFSMLSTTAVLEENATGRHGILQGLKTGGIHIDCSTVSPALTKKLEQLYASDGRVFLHCPVLGSIPQATEGSLLLLPGGSSEAVQQVEPLLKDLGSKIWRFPRAEDASHAKLLCNLFIAGAITTLGQALVFAEKASVSPRTILDIIGNSALNSPTYQTKGKSILDGNFAPRFFTEHMLKDVTLMIEAAAQKGVRLPTIEVAQQLLTTAVDNGLGKEDYSSVVKVLKDLK